MTLILEIEYLSGVSFAAIGPDRDAPDWPPQPDRIFSALVATWAARHRGEGERQALEWLEQLPVPYIIASRAEPRTPHASYVPPNDYKSPDNELRRLKWYRDYLSEAAAPPEKGGHRKPWLRAFSVFPEARRRFGLKERIFPAARPHDPLVRLLWPDAAPAAEVLAALQLLAGDTAYIGHSASLTRCRFSLDPSAGAPAEAKLPERRIYPGRFAELRRAFDASPRRRPTPGAPVAPAAPPKHERVNIFGEHWMILEHIGGEMPDIRASALLSKALRDTLMSGYQRIGLGHEIPLAVSGHARDGAPAPHLAIIPLPFAGFRYADGHVMGFALVPPRHSAILDDENFRKALRGLAPIDEERGRRILTLTSKERTPQGQAFSIQLSPTFEPSALSLDPGLYLASARSFATLTPIALDRHLKAKGADRQAEVNAQIASACRNIGLPEPAEVLADKHSALEGVPSAYPSGKSPSWLGWRLPPSLASRQLTHAVIRFPAPVEGPVILCAGRFLGLGLCRPITAELP